MGLQCSRARTNDRIGNLTTSSGSGGRQSGIEQWQRQAAEQHLTMSSGSVIEQRQRQTAEQHLKMSSGSGIMARNGIRQ